MTHTRQPIDDTADEVEAATIPATESSVAAIVTFDAGMAITEFNPGAERLFALSRTQALGQHLGALLFPGQLQQRVLDDIATRLAASQACESHRVELVATRGDGRRVPVEFGAACLTRSPPRQLVALVRELDGRQRLVDELRGQADRLARIARAQQQLAANDATEDELLLRAPAMAQRALAADSAAIELIDGDTLVQHAAAGAAQDRIGTRLSIQDSLSGLAVRLRRTLCSADCVNDPRVDAAACLAAGARSMVVAPIELDDGPIGVVKITAVDANRFSEADVHALGMFATSLGGMIQRKRNVEALRHSEEQYRMLFRDNPQPMWVFDLQTLRFLAVSTGTPRRSSSA